MDEVEVGDLFFSNSKLYIITDIEEGNFEKEHGGRYWAGHRPDHKVEYRAIAWCADKHDHAVMNTYTKLRTKFIEGNKRWYTVVDPDILGIEAQNSYNKRLKNLATIKAIQEDTRRFAE